MARATWNGELLACYDVVDDGQVSRDAAWYYPVTKDAAKHVECYVAFWHGVTVRRLSAR